MRYVHGLAVLATVLMPTAVSASERTGSHSIASGDLHPAGKAFTRVVVAPKAADGPPALVSE